ncbi:MAG TPA: monothiol bacilliredoxin BrxC family protein [Gemmatimonadales bacterium]|nr:monothiol bacilliredoxin BrxC family protein [Gemmatimonadales bacterium]
MYQIAGESDLALLLAAPLAVLYKHSPICPTSSMAYDEMLLLTGRRPVPVYLLDVVRHRLLSRALAQRIGVAHASPQAIILRGGAGVWHRSHFDVQADAVARALDELAAAAAGGT